MPKWRSGSVFGTGRRVPLNREQRAVWKAKLGFQRRPGRLSVAAVAIARVLADMMGEDGRLDPSIATLAARATVDPSTVTRCLTRLREWRFLTWDRRLKRDATTGGRTEQDTNAYVLTDPACNVHFAPAVHSHRSKGGDRPANGQESAYASAARQLKALGMPVPIAWGIQ